MIQCSARNLLEERLITEDPWVNTEVRVARVRRRRQLPSSGAKVYRLGAHQGDRIAVRPERERSERVKKNPASNDGDCLGCSTVRTE
jgi:hypothetical protein